VGSVAVTAFGMPERLRRTTSVELEIRLCIAVLFMLTVTTPVSLFTVAGRLGALPSVCIVTDVEAWFPAEPRVPPPPLPLLLPLPPPLMLVPAVLVIATR